MINRVPVLRMREFLLVTLQEDIDDAAASKLNEDVAQHAAQLKARGVIIDVSGLEIIDSFMGRTLGTIAATLKLLDAPAVLVGVQPHVAMTITELGLSIPQMKTAQNVERGLQLLERLQN